ncbi:centrosomal protein of 41 kDa-like [Homarus americanus]|uniref:Centrosomal protein of 41 kDa-like n=1 Tax=Homarus americanus TaxID=6706 RepID=A0A8J5NC03_HOMAM|nr:centrosomal protein of 41 kDa-like [Homarus americanus]XP_042233149.1 centrosomal protein of 41 kDa-like [Homarus americanus]XP_042233152.1 centrosomal protein of 41 kDa-like [Homarus americanus]KAG7176651.1 Centrosomal protein of 41 kDa-like [Homarus americanus]
MHSRKFIVKGCQSVNTLKKYSVSDRGILDKRVKSNPRYTGVRSRTDTGFNTQRRQELEHEIRKYYKVRNDEVFRRISLADMLQLMVAHAEDVEAIECITCESEVDNNEAEVPLKYRDEVDCVVHKMDQLEVDSKTNIPQCPYVMIDVRPQGEFKTCHLATAVSHPHSRLSRAVGWECPELLIYKNHPEFIIIVYDEGEDLAPEVAATLQHRGYGNVFMLSGGLRLAKDKFGFPLVTENTAGSLSFQVVDAISQQLSNTVLPPLSMADASEWWAAASKLPNSATDSGITHTTPSTGRQTTRSQIKDKDGQPARPWR